MGSNRKHITQIRPEEQSLLLERLINIKKWRISGHLKERLAERGGSVTDVLELITNGNIIEFHNRDGDNRILLRGTKVFHKDVLCAVFSLKGNVVTLYWNKANDEHRTLKLELYNEELEVADYVNS